MRRGLTSMAVYMVSVVAVVVVANAAVPREGLPNYGTWTGIRPLEEKLEKLEQFRRDGTVDALILGSSVADFGFNAQTFSDVLTEETGSTYRAFNFSTGAAEVVTLPKLYRLARTVVRPRTLVLVVPFGVIRSNTIPPRSPDYIMERAPIHRALTYPWLLPFDKQIWQAPLIKYAPALRDQFISGRFANLPAQGSDLYRITPHGDTINYSYQSSDQELIYYRDLGVKQFSRFSDSEYVVDKLPLQDQLKHYFNDIDIEAMRELRELSHTDGYDIIVVAHGVAWSLYQAPLDVAKKERRGYFEAMAEALGARLVYEIDEFGAPPFAISDLIHLNYYGSVELTTRVAKNLTRKADPSANRDAWAELSHPQLIQMPSTDVTINVFSALITGPASPDQRTLQLQLPSNHAIPVLPAQPIHFAVRLPDNTDLIAPAQRAANGIYEAAFPAAPVGSHQLFYARVVVEAGGRFVTLNQPITEYAWGGN